MKKFAVITIEEIGNLNKRVTRINVKSAKKRMETDLELLFRDLEYTCIDRAVEKLYGKGKYFIADNTGIHNRGQIWQHSPYGGSDPVTGAVNIDFDFEN